MKWLILILLVACAKEVPPPEKIIVVHATSTLRVNFSTEKFIDGDTGQNQDVQVTNNAVSEMTLAPFVNPDPFTSTSSTTFMDLGNIAISDLFDNDLWVCGGKCSNAGIRLSMLNQPGLVNSNDANDLIPVHYDTNLLGMAPVVAQTISIGVFKFNVRLSDFTPAPDYLLKLDLSKAGSGLFSGTVVVEYFLSN